MSLLYYTQILILTTTILTYRVYDSGTEKRFAESLDKDSRIKLFVKLPNWFKINTPIGSYNPDWAIAVEDINEYGEVRDRLYLVRETKNTAGSSDLDNIRPIEKKKIECAKEHFNKVFERYDDSNYKAIDVPEDIDDLKKVIEF